MSHHDHHDHDHTEPPSDIELRVKALESLLVEKGLVDPEALDALIDLYEDKIGPSNGKHVVAHAWADEEFKRWLLDDPNAAIASMGYVGSQGEQVRVVENTDDVHNLVVCTLCSCYPWPLLGLPPVWYKSAPYRAQAVADPRGVIRQFGSEVPEEKEVRVWDSTSEMRYLVLPQRPARHRRLERGAADGTRDAQLHGRRGSRRGFRQRRARHERRPRPRRDAGVRAGAAGAGVRGAGLPRGSGRAGCTA